jgi:hypothetical protein
MSITITGERLSVLSNVLAAVCRQRMPPQGARHFAHVAAEVRKLLLPVVEEFRLAQAEDRADEFNAAMVAREFVLDVRPVPLELIGAAELTPAEYEALADLFLAPANAA